MTVLGADCLTVIDYDDINSKNDMMDLILLRKCSQRNSSIHSGSKTFPGFHSSLIKQYIPKNHQLFPGRKVEWPQPIVTEDGIEEFFVDKIVDARWHGCGIQYLV
jgi:hypothetical protein